MLDDTLRFLPTHLEAPDWWRMWENLPVERLQHAVEHTYTTSIHHQRLLSSKLFG
jgi:hypothetical protein